MVTSRTAWRLTSWAWGQESRSDQASARPLQGVRASECVWVRSCAPVHTCESVRCTSGGRPGPRRLLLGRRFGPIRLIPKSVTHHTLRGALLCPLGPPNVPSSRGPGLVCLTLVGLRGGCVHREVLACAHILKHAHMSVHTEPTRAPRYVPTGCTLPDAHSGAQAHTQVHRDTPSSLTCTDTLAGAHTRGCSPQRPQFQPLLRLPGLRRG